MEEKLEKKEVIKTGDLILVFHGNVAASYPGYAGVRYLVRLGSGSIQDISSEVISELTDLGWTLIE